MNIGYSSLGGTSTLISGTNGRLLYGTSQAVTLSANQEIFRCFIGYGGANNTATANFQVGIYDVSGGNVTTAPRLYSTSLSIDNAVEGANTTQRWLEFAIGPVDLSAHAGKDLAFGFADSASNTGFNIPLVVVTGANRKNHTGANNVLPSTMANSTVTSNQAWSMYFETRTISSQTVTSINGGSAITAGQAGIAAVLTGFTALPTITTNTSGVTVSSISGTANNPTFNISDRVEGGLYPALPSSVQFTFTNGAELASGSQSVTFKAGEVKQTFVAAIISDSTYITTLINEDGHTVNGGDFYYTPYGDLTIAADGKVTVSTAGVFNGWFRASSGTNAGRMYEYTVTVTEAGEVSTGGGEVVSRLAASKIRAYFI